VRVMNTVFTAPISQLQKFVFDMYLDLYICRYDVEGLGEVQASDAERLLVHIQSNLEDVDDV